MKLTDEQIAEIESALSSSEDARLINLIDTIKAKDAEIAKLKKISNGWVIVCPKGHATQVTTVTLDTQTVDYFATLHCGTCGDIIMNNEHKNKLVQQIEEDT